MAAREAGLVGCSSISRSGHHSLGCGKQGGLHRPVLRQVADRDELVESLKDAHAEDVGLRRALEPIPLQQPSSFLHTFIEIPRSTVEKLPQAVLQVIWLFRVQALTITQNSAFVPVCLSASPLLVLTGRNHDRSHA